MAVTIDAIELRKVTGIDVAQAPRLLAVATALVNRFAPNCPDEIANEAAILTAGYIWESPAGAVRSERQGDVETTYAPTHTGALRYSGAMSLLSPWKVRRGGAI